MNIKSTIGLLVLVSVIMGSCKKNEPTPQSNIRFLHFSANAPTLDYSINNSLFVGNSGYGLPTAYRTTNAGAVSINVSQTGNTATLFNIKGNFSANKYYSVVLFDSVAKVKVSVFEDNRTAPPAGKCNVRFLHLGTDQGPVDIIKAGGISTLFSNRSFNDHSTTPSFTSYTAIDPGPFSASAIVAGSSNFLVADLPTFAATAGKSYTIILRGFKKAVPFSQQGILLGFTEDK